MPRWGPLKERFLKKIRIDPATHCWNWSAARIGKYGAFRNVGQQLAHRAAWKIFRTEPIDDLWVLHRCDNPLCVNPDHLFLGTPSDNVQDMFSKGRDNIARGERHGHRKLTWLQVREIRASAEHYKVLAKKFGVHDTSILHIRRGDCWREEYVQ